MKNPGTSMLSSVTILVPTRKRYSYLLRLLKFYQSYNLGIKILILDSTPDGPSNGELIKLLSLQNILWKRYHSDSTFWDRVADGTEFIDTDYVTMCADDDFIIPAALSECVDFLSTNPDYSCAHGLYFLHYFKEVNGYYLSIEPNYEKMKSALGETGRERLEAYLSGKSLLPIYALHRTDVFRLIWTETREYVSDWNLFELFPCCLSLVYGKMKILPVFYASREPHTYFYNDYELFKRAFSEEKVRKAVEGVGKHLSNVDGLSLEESERIASVAFKGYMDKVEKKMLEFQPAKDPHAPPFPLWKRVKQQFRIRSRWRNWRYKGCHPSIYPHYFDDYKKVEDAVLSAGLTQEDLNVSRQDYAKYEVNK